jgi:RHS repeat-associated protein
MRGDLVWPHATLTATVTLIIRTITYTYDGLQRLTGATESPGSNFAYSYDLAGNRTGVTVNGTAILTNTYDAAGNLTNDGVTSYGYDATNDLTGTTTTGQSRAYSYNGDGTLSLAAYQSQMLAGTVGITTTDYLYGQDIAPLVALTGGTRIWYGLDRQGSVRQSLNDSGTVLGVQNYDPFGQIEAGSSLIGPFGYTGELQDTTTGQEYLRARWYQPGSGTLLGVDPELASTGQPYSYAYNDPINGSDPFGLASCSWYDVGCEYTSIHTAAQQSSFGRGFYTGTTSLIRGVGTVAGAFGDSTFSCGNPFDQTNCRNQWSGQYGHRRLSLCASGRCLPRRARRRRPALFLHRHGVQPRLRLAPTPLECLERLGRGRNRTGRGRNRGRGPEQGGGCAHRGSRWRMAVPSKPAAPPIPAARRAAKAAPRPLAVGASPATPASPPRMGCGR